MATTKTRNELGLQKKFEVIIYAMKTQEKEQENSKCFKCGKMQISKVFILSNTERLLLPTCMR